jgi:hemolysin activation/secretion protein
MGVLIFAAGIAHSLPLHAQEPPASPLAAGRPVQETAIPSLIIEQVGFNDVACERAVRQSRVPVKQLKIERFVVPGASKTDVALPVDLQEFLVDQGNKFLKRQVSSTDSPAFSLCNLRAMASSLTQLHQQRTGQALSRVLIPAQDITDGVLDLKVLEGRLEAYSVRRALSNAEGQYELVVTDDAQNRETVEALKLMLDPYLNKPLLSRDLERAMLLVGEITGQQISGTLGPGQQSMGTVLDLEVRPERSWQASMSVDNYGSPSIGRNQLAGSLGKSGLLRPSDRLSLTYFTSQDHSALHSWGLSYDTPVGMSGWRAGVRSALTQYAIAGELASAQSRGDAGVVSVYASYPVVRALHARTDLNLGYSNVDLKDTTSAGANARQAHVLWGDIRGVSRDSLGSNGWGVGLTAGQLRFDTDQQTSADAAGLRRNGDYLVLNYDYKRQQLLAHGFDAIFSLRGQVASKNLDSYHKLSLGGVNGVRAFVNGEASADRGYISRIELGYSIAQMGQRISAFYDIADAQINQKPLAASATSNALRLAGSGLQWDAQVTSGVRLRIFYAHIQGGGRSVSAVDGKKSRIGFDLSYTF